MVFPITNGGTGHGSDKRREPSNSQEANPPTITLSRSLRRSNRRPPGLVGATHNIHPCKGPGPAFDMLYTRLAVRSNSEGIETRAIHCSPHPTRSATARGHGPHLHHLAIEISRRCEGGGGVPPPSVSFSKSASRTRHSCAAPGAEHEDQNDERDSGVMLHSAKNYRGRAERSADGTRNGALRACVRQEADQDGEASIPGPGARNLSLLDHSLGDSTGTLRGPCFNAYPLAI